MPSVFEMEAMGDSWSAMQVVSCMLLARINSDVLTKNFNRFCCLIMPSVLHCCTMWFHSQINVTHAHTLCLIMPSVFECLSMWFHLHINVTHTHTHIWIRSVKKENNMHDFIHQKINFSFMYFVFDYFSFIKGAPMIDWFYTVFD